MSVPDPTLERLNYFNGQRLEATDFRAEQAYHMAVRRWLNRSLYSPGIAAGLEVSAHPTDKHKVVVSEGLAIDAQGREIILTAPREVLARGVPSAKAGLVLGNYLVISYYESKAGSAEEGCRIDAGASLCKGGGCGCGGSCGCGCSGNPCTCGSGKCRGEAGDTGTIWGGKTRVRADPLLEFQNTWPTKASGKLVLAQLNLNAQCQVVDVLAGMRQYTYGMQAPKVRALSLEGEKDIDHNNPKVLFFEIDGANPQRVTLHLWATKFSSLHYTELGKHTHDVTGKTDEATHDFKHSHTVIGGKTSEDGAHDHNYRCDDATNQDLRVISVTGPPGGVIVYDVQAHKQDQVMGFDGLPAIIEAPGHTHTLALNDALASWPHGHTVTGTTLFTGASNASAHDGKPALSYIDTLKVELDSTDITALILAHLEGLSPGDWAKLGDGQPTHALASNTGTGAVDLKQLGIEFPPGSHKLVFSVPANAGGQLHYNLYVE